MNRYILAIDPANIESTYVFLDKNLKPIEFGKIPNEDLLQMLRKTINSDLHIAIEGIVSYGSAVGKSVFETCIWIGRFIEALEPQDVKLIYRTEEKMNLCHKMRGVNDSVITQALIDRFAPDTPNKGKGTKKEQGYFYGFKKDIWQAYAVGVTYYDMYIKKRSHALE